jgi:ABC-2 type transport system ATP-binding protein
VLLSSHILSEVEATCDRVGILRKGRLVDEGTMAQLRHLGAQTIDVTFSGAPPQLPPLPGIRTAGAGTNTLRFEVSGAMAPLIGQLADQPVVSLSTHQPSLEEIFLHHYDSSDGRVGG